MLIMLYFAFAFLGAKSCFCRRCITLKWNDHDLVIMKCYSFLNTLADPLICNGRQIIIIFFLGRKGGRRVHFSLLSNGFPFFQ